MHLRILSLLGLFLISLPLQDGSPSPESLHTRALAILATADPDFSEAAALLKQAADKGLPRSQRSLGELYRDGRGVPKDPSMALALFRKAADAGDARAQAHLGTMYADGVVVNKDEKQAVNWYRKAAAQDDAYGQLGLGVMYMNGRGVSKDLKEAVNWFRKAAEQGVPLAQFALGSIYASVDRQEAIQWYTKALQQGFELARAPLEALRNSVVLSPAEAEALLTKKMVPVDVPLARAARVYGAVQIEIYVDVQGKVNSYKVVSGHTLLQKGAVETVRALRYKPLLVNGQPRPFTTIVVVDY